jgi:N-methylhydantoinase B
VQLKPGDVVSYCTCGGGGYGSPLERDPTLVLHDVREGKVSVEQARIVYGVVIDPVNGEVSEGETAQRRGSL